MYGRNNSLCAPTGMILKIYHGNIFNLKRISKGYFKENRSNDTPIVKRIKTTFDDCIPMPDQLYQLTITIKGAVQGVGFRPFVFRVARAHGIRGFVRNDGQGVFISAVARRENCDAFVDALKTTHPPLAVIRSFTAAPMAPFDEVRESGLPAGFAIVESDRGERIDVDITRDAAVCDNCLREMRDPHNRRYRHPFINCTDCGPRYTIIKDLPYDRPSTTMAVFTMCEECRKEYETPGDRRFHAQPICCPSCGPTLQLLGADAQPIADQFAHNVPPRSPSSSADRGPCLSPALRGELGMSAEDDGDRGGTSVTTSDPTARCISMLAAGMIVAIKGIGGFHLACRADDEAVVKRLRQRKMREEKPLAIMVRDLGVARKYALVNDQERALMEGVERPIVLCVKKNNAAGLAPSIAPRVPTLGIMLPYTPLHHLLFSGNRFDALVMTSGNMTDEPIVFSNKDALSRLCGIADAFLFHDRDIYVRNDDSIVRMTESGPTMQRRSRGYVPDPLDAMHDVHGIIGFGGVLKSTAAIGRKRMCYLSQYVGEVSSLETLDGLRRIVKHLLHILDVSPQLSIVDLHPEALTRSIAEELGTRIVTAQHHHAHAAACMAENELNGNALCIVYDGTGYGADGSIWGGEIFLAGHNAFTRIGHLSYLPLPGGEAAIMHPGRTAIAALYGLFGERVKEACLWMPEAEKEAVVDMIRSGVNCPKTSSMGRLFDAASALIGICTRRTYEGQPAIELEGCADVHETGEYQPAIANEAGMLLIDGATLLAAVYEDFQMGTAREKIAARFHTTVARATALLAREAANATGCSRVCLSGGCFQNPLLLDRTRAMLLEAGLQTFTHRRLPPGDECISYGQLVIAGAQRENEK